MYETLHWFFVYLILLAIQKSRQWRSAGEEQFELGLHRHQAFMQFGALSEAHLASQSLQQAGDMQFTWWVLAESLLAYSFGERAERAEFSHSSSLTALVNWVLAEAARVPKLAGFMGLGTSKPCSWFPFKAALLTFAGLLDLAAFAPLVPGSRAEILCNVYSRLK